MALRICFIFYGNSQPELAKRMVASVRYHMPYVTVTQLTDTRTKALADVDEVRRVEGSNYAYLIYKHMLTCPEPFIRLDYDMLLQGDISHVLEDTDLAFNRHGDPSVLNSEWGRKYPYATCMWASNNGREFVEDFRRIHLESQRDDWLGLVPSVNDAIEQTKLKVTGWDGSVYNYTPKDRNDKPEGVYILHYKGMRKEWMLPEDQGHLVKNDKARISQSVKGFKFES